MGNPFDFRQPESQAGASAAGSDWEDVQPAPALTIARPPLYWLIAAASAALLATLLALVAAGSMSVALVAWLLAGPVAVALLGVFMSRDVVARSAPVYVSPQWLKWGIRAVIVLIGVGVVLSSWRVADWVSRG